VLLFLLNY